MIIETLAKRRDEMAAQIKELRANLKHIDATIRLFAEEDEKLRLKRGDISRKLFDALRNAGKPTNTRDISITAGIDMKRVGIALNAQHKKGLVKFRRGNDGMNLWELTG